MSPDLSPSPETTRDIGQTPSSPSNPVDALSQSSGVSPSVLSRLSPDEFSGMQRLEADVARAESSPGEMTPDALRAVVGARDQVRADITQRYGEAPVTLADATVTIDRRAAPAQPSATAPATPDATLQIQNDTITIGSDVYLYGSGATAEVAATYERQIREEWGQNPDTDKPWTYTDPDTGKVYDVKFDVNVRVYDPAHPERTPGVKPDETPSQRDNFIEVTAVNGRSYVQGGDSGQWRADGRGGRSLADDNPAAHEFGHILGLPDRYVEGGGPQPGWDGAMMAMPAGQGHVQQRDIDAVVQSHVRDYVKQGSPATFTSPIGAPAVAPATTPAPAPAPAVPTRGVPV